VPSVTQVGPSVVRHAIRLPPRAELRFTPSLHPAAAASAASVVFKVTLQKEGGGEEELWSQVVGPGAKTSEVSVDLPGNEGDLALLGLHVSGRDRFAWGTWTAPRVMGAAAGDEARPEADEKRADRLREAVRGMNVVLVILDAARADHFGAYGYARPTTPEIDRIAAESVVFDRVYTPAVYTLGAMASVWTSQPPDRHHGDVSFSAKLPRDRLTLAELLGARGVHTAGFVANTVAGGLNGFDRGFGEFHELWRTHGSRGDVFKAVLPGWLDANGARRFFAYVHFREPHSPYDPEPPFDTRFGPDGPIPKAARRPPGDRWIVDVNQGRRTLTPEEADHLVRLYDGNLAYADQQVGELRRALEARGLWDKTVFIVAADHGEALLEHGWIGHNVQLYEESIHVPLVVRFPPVAGIGGRRVEALADLIDLGPTIADLFGARGTGGSDRAFAGRSLLPVVEGAPGHAAVLTRTIWDRPIYARLDGRRKLIYDTRTGAQRLFDLQDDPRETRDRAAEQPVAAAYHRQALQAAIARLARRPVASGTDEAGMTREQCENLKTLGYVSAAFDCSKLP